MSKNIQKILIIEDHEDLNELLEMAFGAEGFEVQMALNGKSGLEKFKIFHPDLVLVDLMMPEMDGFEVLAALREGNGDIPIGIISNLHREGDQARAQKMGANFFIKKSHFTPLELVEEVKRYIK